MGCEAGSGDEAERMVDIYVNGFYRNGSNGNVVAHNSGNAITTMQVRQSGASLEAVDNNNMIFRGSIGDVFGDSPRMASFNLDGMTTIGAPATISGQFEVKGETCVMRATWIEDGTYSTVFGTATVPPAPISGIDITGPESVSVGSTNVYTANGGVGNYTWSISNGSIGSLINTSGSSVPYAATAAGSQTITATDSSGNKGNIAVSQQ